MDYCSVENCTGEASKRGMCNRHYIRWRRHGDTDAMLIRRYQDDQTCDVADCDKAPLARGWCKSHYEKWAKYGNPLSGPPPREPHAYQPRAPWPDRFWEKVQRGPGCWLWTGTATKKENGYGQISVGGRVAVAHRVAYELLVGPIPEGLELDHIRELCTSRLCVKVIADEHGPAHLEPVTPYENFFRGRSIMADRLRQTHCHRGHPLTGDNLIICNGGRSRRCRECKRINDAARRAAKRG